MARKQTKSEKRMEILSDYLNDNRNKSYFVTAVTVVFIALFLIFGIIPSYQAILAQQRENSIINDTNSKLVEKITDMEKLLQESKDKSTTISTFNSVFPNGYNQDELLLELFNMVRDSSSYIKNVDFYIEEQRTPPLTAEFGVNQRVNVVNMNIEVEGTKAGVLNFLKEFEGSKRLFNITSMEINRNTEERISQFSGLREYRLNLFVEYFYFGEAENIENEEEIFNPSLIQINN